VRAELDHPDGVFDDDGVPRGPVVELAGAHGLVAAVLVVDADASLEHVAPVWALAVVRFESLK
jgi:hypothetical protein